MTHFLLNAKWYKLKIISGSYKAVIMFIIWFLPVLVYSQTAENEIFNKGSKDKYLIHITKQYRSISEKMERRTANLLKRMQSLELEVRQKAIISDSSKMMTQKKEVLREYSLLTEKLSSIKSENNNGLRSEYLPGLDSIETGLKFLSQPAMHLTGIQAGNIDLLKHSISELHASVEKESEVNIFLKQRIESVKKQFARTKLPAGVLGMEKQAYYYNQKITELKEGLHDPQKAERTVLEMLHKYPGFDKYFNENSYASKLFSLPANYSDPASLKGLQTKTLVSDNLRQISTGFSERKLGSGPQDIIIKQLGSAMEKLNDVKKLTAKYHLTTPNDFIPDFRVDEQKSKTWTRRITYGMDMQSKPVSLVLPHIATIGFNIGYKLNDRSVLGAGGSFLLGTGNGWQHVTFSTEGAGYRAFFDFKMKYSFFIKGAYEANYFSSFEKLSQEYNIKTWQHAALFGIGKRIKTGKQRTSDVQLLFDALYKQHIPTSQPIILRTGFSFK